MVQIYIKKRNYGERDSEKFVIFFAFL